MYLFACEASSATASVALLNDDKLIGEFSVNAGNTHTENLLPMTDALLSAASVGVSDIALFVLSAGPGSFTGVRIAAAHIKGLAFGREVPAVAVSTLEALAENVCGFADIAVPCLDARRGQIYSGVFDVSGSIPLRICADDALSASLMADKLQPYIEEGRTIAVPGDGSAVLTGVLRDRGANLVDVSERDLYQSAASAAKVGLRLFRQGEYTDAASLRPVYLRIPQAERDRLAKLRETGDAQ